jgi:hypothetical protein
MNFHFKEDDLKSITLDLINLTPWEVIELNLKVDKDKIQNYYEEVESKLSHLFFDFSYKQYLNDEVISLYKEKNQVSNYVGNIGAWTVSWPIERDIPIPGQYQANLNIYPELLNCDFYYDSKPLSYYKFGYMNSLLEKLTERALRQMLISKHPPGLYVLPHVDSKSIKMHLPLKTNSNAYFYFGEYEEHKYYMEVGKIYLINPSITHGTKNDSPYSRTHLLSRVDNDYVLDLLKMDGII